MRRRSAALLTGPVAGCLAAAALVVAAPSADAAGERHTTTFTTPGTHTFVVPQGVTSLDVRAVGGRGGGAPGLFFKVPGGPGAVVTSSLAVSPGRLLTVTVGGDGLDGAPPTQRAALGTAGDGGANGGGHGDPGYWFPTLDLPFLSGGGGGGSSDIRFGTTLADRVVVAAGGGGAGSTPGGGGGTPVGGDGGAPAGEVCLRHVGYGTGATPTTPGVQFYVGFERAAGALLTGGVPDFIVLQTGAGGGGGGAGRYGGGAGGDGQDAQTCSDSSGGGGGSSWVDPQSGSSAQYALEASDDTPSVSLSWTSDWHASVTLSAPSSVVPAGTAVTYTATVTPLPEAGTVAFTDGPGLLAGCAAQPIVRATASATCTVTYTSADAGQHGILASYSGAPDWAPATSAGWLQVVTAAPAITTTTLPQARKRRPYTADIATTGYPAAVLRVTAGALPPGLSLSPAGVLTGTPRKDGTWRFTVTATNGTSPDARARLTLRVR